MPRSFLIKKKRQNAFKMDCRKDEILNSNMQSLPQNSEDVVHRGHSLSNKNEATEPKFSNFQAPCVEEKSLETKYSIYFQIPHNLDFSQSNGGILPANERSLQYLSATMAEERNSARKKLMERSFGADLDKKESLLLPSVVKMEASDYEDGVQNVMWERNKWQSSFVDKSVHEDLNTQPMCHHSEVKMGSKETTSALIYEKNNKDFEVSEFLQERDAGGTLKRKQTVAHSIKYPTPSSSSEEGVKQSMFSSENATEVSALQQKSAKACGSSNRKYRYTCDVCGKSFSRSNTLTTHRRIHTGDKPFICEQCGRAFRQPGNLTRHRLTHTTVKPYVCLQCNKAFNRASNLHTHMRTHTNYKPFVCDFCGKGFHQKIDMKIHRYTHTGEKPHKCDKCGRGFKQLTHLTYHLRTHSEMRLYQCEYCGKGFNQKGNLQAHIYGHTGERPFKCQICGKGFTLASTLNTHKRTHASKKPFQCQFCTKAFYQKNALKTHYIASHPFANGISIL